MFNHNAQGNYNAGRGQDGLGRFASRGSRFGSGVQVAGRPGHVGGRSTFAIDRTLEAPAGKRRSPIRISMPTVEQSLTIRRRKPSRGKVIRDRRQFVNWLKNWSPGLYQDAKRKADQVAQTEGTLDGLSGWWETFTESIGGLGEKYVQFKTQKEILDAQMERMRLGYPPLQTGEYAPTVVVKPDAGTTREITGAIGAGISGLLPWLLAGGVGLFFLLKK